MDRWIMDRQTDRWMDKKMDRKTDGQMDIKLDGQVDEMRWEDFADAPSPL
jgi:hypothetical protein